MVPKPLLLRLVAVGADVALVLTACGSRAKRSSKAAKANYLPKCAGLLLGSVAYVSTPSSLWQCADLGWIQIPCTNFIAGAVAYASDDRALYECSDRQWQQVVLAEGPAGARGPKGDAGAPGPAGL